MRELTIGKNDAGARLDRFLGKALPLLPPALAQKYIRIKRVKVNGGRAQRDQRLQEGDVLQLYINDEFFDKPSEENMFLTLFKPRLTVVYEDEHLLLADKPQGMVVPRRRDGEGQHAHQPHSGVSVPEAGVEPQVGECLCAGAVQPHRPQHRRHRHRRQGCRDAAAHQREDTPAGAGQAVSVRDGGASEAGQRARGVLPFEGRAEKAGDCISQACTRRQDRHHRLSGAGNAGRAEPGGDAGWRPGAPTRSGRPWPIWAVRCWGTASTGGAT